MRKLIIAALAALAIVVVGTGGWFVAVRLLHDPVAAGRALIAKGEFHAASLELRNAVRSQPGNAVAHALLGGLLLQGGDPVAAEKELKQARELHYPGSEVVPLLARSYLAQQRFRDLLREFAPTADLPPEQAASLLISRSLASVALGDSFAGRASAAAAQRLLPTSPEAPLAAARILSVAGEQAEALHKLDQALALDPRLIEALGLKADIERSQGLLETAAATLDGAVAIAPSLPRVRLARARVRLLLGQDAAAREDLDRALKGDPKNTFALYLRAILLIRAHDWPAADVALQQIQPVLPRVPRGEYYEGLVKANVNQLQQAADSAGHYAARNPGDADAFRLLARIDLALGKSAEAAQALRQVADLGGAEAADAGPGAIQARTEAAKAGDDATSSEGLTHLASLQLDAGDAAGAEADLQKSLENTPRREDTGALRVAAALAAADVDAAAAALEQLRRTPAADPEAVGNLTGLVRLAQLDFAGARAAWEAALLQAPKSVPVQLNLVRVLVLQGQLDAAETRLAGMLAAQPGQRAALRAFVELEVGRGRLPAALAAVQTARKASPPGLSHGQAALGLLVTEAALRARAGDYGGAYGVLDGVALELAQAPLLLTVRAQILQAQGRNRESVDTYRQLLIGSPGDLAIRQQLMQLLAQQADAATDAKEAAALRAEAVRVARDGLLQAPGNSTLLQALVGAAARADGVAAAVAEADKLRSDPINLPVARLLKGGVYLTAKRYEDAVAAYQAELREAPFDTLAIAAATALRGAGHDAQAAALLHDWLARQSDAAVSNVLAGMQIELHQYDAAAEQLAAVLADRPNDAVALNNLAWIYQQRHDAKALGFAQRAWLLAPSGQTADTLGWVLAEQGRTDVAILLLRRARSQLPDNPTVAFHLAAALMAAGQRADAQTLVNAVLAVPQEFDEKEQARQLQAQLSQPLPK